LYKVASVGKKNPLEIQLYVPIKKKAITNLIRFTASEPTFFPADSKAKAVTVQNTAVKTPAISPKWFCIEVAKVAFKNKKAFPKKGSYY
ncbi:MAG: hypothetical protein R3182_12035, partial [Draconibacterium sp.]|nr:hypothetical protein [Draconibacterium sp.]